MLQELNFLDLSLELCSLSSVFLHVCRALAIGSVGLGFWGSVLTLIGMKCTKIGGSEVANARVTLAAGFTYMASGRAPYFRYCSILSVNTLMRNIFSNHRTCWYGSVLHLGKQNAGRLRGCKLQATEVSDHANGFRQLLISIQIAIAFTPVKHLRESYCNSSQRTKGTSMALNEILILRALQPH